MRCFGTAQDIFVLDSTFALIEGHPQFIMGNEKTPRGKEGWATRPSSLLGFARSEWITRESRFYSRKVEGERRTSKMSDERNIYSAYPQLLHHCFLVLCYFYC